MAGAHAVAAGREGVIRGEVTRQTLVIGYAVPALTGHLTGSGFFSNYDGRHWGYRCCSVKHWHDLTSVLTELL